MQLIKRRREVWDPFRELEDLSSKVNRLFGMTRWPGNGEREPLAMSDWSPSCDISETGSEYRISVELPNVKKEDVHVTLENGVLTIQGERQEEKEERGIKYHRRESSYGKFVRRFTLPEDADESIVDASFKDGVLAVAIAKSKTKQSSTREVSVH